MRKFWSRRSSRENNAGLACGHEQLKRLKSARQVDCVYSVCTDWWNRERSTTGHSQRDAVHRSHTKIARQAASNAATVHGETTVRQELIAHSHCLNRCRALVHKTVCSCLETWRAQRLKKTSCVHLIPHLPHTLHFHIFYICSYSTSKKTHILHLFMFFHLHVFYSFTYSASLHLFFIFTCSASFHFSS